jgi:pyruvate/2-oxoglutarate dehydrogenase complex dihydrolipoamide acyltransferase (E2) component
MNFGGNGLMRYPVVVPPTADGSLAVTIAVWIKGVNSPVTKGEDLVEATTEKITLYVTAPTNGTLVEIIAPVGSQVQVGEVIGVVEGAS